MAEETKVQIVLTQTDPVHCYEVKGYRDHRDFNDILAWLHRGDLPEHLYLGFEGALFHFSTHYERVHFALGFSKAFDLVHDEGRLD